MKPFLVVTVKAKIPANEMMNFAFKLGKLAPHMENANVGVITCVQCQIDDPDIKITPRGPRCQIRPWRLVVTNKIILLNVL